MAKRMSSIAQRLGVAGLVAWLGLVACASTRPPCWNVPGIEKIGPGCLKSDAAGCPVFDRECLQGSDRAGFSIDLRGSGPVLVSPIWTKVGVFGSDKGELVSCRDSASDFTQALNAALLARQVELVERTAALKEVLRELEWGKDSRVDQETAARIGQLTNAKTLLVVVYRVDVRSSGPPVPRTCRSVFSSGAATVGAQALELKAVDIEKGQVKGAFTLRAGSEASSGLLFTVLAHEAVECIVP